MIIVDENDFKNKIRDFSFLIPRELVLKKDYLGCGITDDYGHPLGVIIYSLSDRGIRIRWIYVKDDNRRKGAGSLLVKNISSSYKKNISVEIFPEPEYSDVYKFFEKLGFSFKLKEKLIYSMPLKELIKLGFFRERAGKKLHPSIKIINRIGKDEKKNILKKLPGKYEYNESISSVCINKGELMGACLIYNSGDEIIYPVYIKSFTDSKKLSPGIIAELFYAAIEQVFTNFGPDAIFSFYCRSESDEALMKRIMGNAGPVEVIEAYLS